MTIDAAGAGRDFWSVFSGLAGRLGGSDAILAPGRESLAFAGLAGRIAATKENLNRLGLGRGDRVAIALPNGPETAVCLLAAIACTTAIPLNPSYTKDEVRQYLGRTRARTLIISAASGAPAREAAEELGIQTIELAVEVSAAAGTFALAGSPAGACKDTGWNTPEDTGLIFLTSGTTSGQKLVPLKPRQVVAHAHGLNAIYRLGPGDRSLVLMPLFHGGGLMSSLLIPLLNGAAVVCLAEFEVSSFFSHLEAFRPTWITAGYAFHKAIVEEVNSHRAVVERSRVRFIKSGSGRLEPALKQALERAFNAPVLDQYSASETGAITCWPMPPGQGKPGTVGRAVFNEVAIMGAGGGLLPTGAEGEVAVRGPGVFDGYLDDPEANAQAFTDGWYRTGDLGRLDADGFLTLTGRTKELINRGGEKISPREVEIVLAAHDAVSDVKVFGIPHPSLGEEVVAAVVLGGGAASESDLKAHAGKRLADFKVPRRIFFRQAFPRFASGKLDARSLALDCELVLQAERAGSGSAGRPLSPIEEVVRGLWQKALDQQRVGPADDFFLLGGDSLRAVDLLVSVERAFGVELPVDTLYGEAATVSGMAAEIGRLQARRGGGREEKTARTSVEAAPAAARSHRGAPPALRPGDIVAALSFLGLAPAAWLLPRKAWSPACRALARAHIALRGSQARSIESALATLQIGTTAEELERQFVSGIYEDILMTLREHLPLPWRPRIRLLGAERIGAARASGRGAVLWSCPSCYGGLISTKGLSAAGIEVVNLRSSVHPYSGTRFGMKVLNPVRTRIEARYVADVVVMEGTDGLGALQKLREHLETNAVINISAHGAEGTALDIPFLGGTLLLSLGAPTLAALHAAPLLPVFTAADGAGGFEVVVGPRIESRVHAYAGETARDLARGYARALEAHLRRHPSEWRGWFMRNSWVPPRPGLDPAIGRE